jgi:hypothetical protein
MGLSPPVRRVSVTIEAGALAARDAPGTRKTIEFAVIVILFLI